MQAGADELLCNAHAVLHAGEGVEVVSWDNGGGDAGTSIKYSGAQQEDDMRWQRPIDRTANQDFVKSVFKGFEETSKEPPVPQHTDGMEDSQDTPAHSAQGDMVDDTGAEPKQAAGSDVCTCAIDCTQGNQV